MYAAVVSFCCHFSRKPKGEEVHSWVHHAYPLLCTMGGDTEESKTECAAKYGDEIHVGKTNLKDVAGWASMNNVSFFEKKATDGTTNLSKHKAVALADSKHGYITTAAYMEALSAQTSQQLVPHLDFRFVKSGTKDKQACTRPTSARPPVLCILYESLLMPLAYP